MLIREEIQREYEKTLRGDNVTNQNANLDGRVFNGREGEANDVIKKELALNTLISPKYAMNHKQNRIYIHDLGSYYVGMHNCLSLPIDKLLKNGLITKQCRIRPARSVRSALQLIPVAIQLQSQCQFGGVSLTHIDTTLVPYVRISFYKHYRKGLMYFDGLGNDNTPWLRENLSIDSEVYKRRRLVYDYALTETKEECKQGIEALFHNLNSLQSRSGNQLPFSSINFGLNTTIEGRMITKTILEQIIRGTGNGETSIFPCAIFQYKQGINDKFGTPNYDLYKLSLKATAKRLYPNYVNCDWSSDKCDLNDPLQTSSTMGCRTYNGFDVNGLGWQRDGRGNCCPVTIILPTIAMESIEEAEENGITMEKGIIELFMRNLKDAIEDAKGSLIERYEWICSQDPSSAPFMYDNLTLEGYDGKTIRSAMQHCTLVIGQLGLAECLQALIGCDHTTKKGMELAHEIEQLFEDMCALFKRKYHLNFGVYFTPAENLCFTAMSKFRDKYGEIQNISDRKYFTNSMHVPVWKEMSPFEKIDIESELTGYHSAGCITYVEIDTSLQDNIDAMETIVNYAMDKDIPYFAINVPNDHCEDCGYTSQIDDVCPMCGGNEIIRLKRVTGRKVDECQ